MFQTTPTKIDNIMQQPASPFIEETNPSLHDVPLSNTLPAGSSEESKMPANVHHTSSPSPSLSGTNTPLSSRSSFSYESNGSSTSTSSQTKRSSMKAAGYPKRRPSPPTVRFAEAESAFDNTPKTLLQQLEAQQQQKIARENLAPNPLLQYQRRPASSILSSTSSRYSLGPPRYTAQLPRGLPPVMQSPSADARVIHRFSAPVQSARPDQRWSGVPLPGNKSTISRPQGSRITSCQSVISNISVQSAPAALPDTTTASPPGQYNPLAHYIPCMYDGCAAHYTPTHAGPTFYLPQGPYSIARLHGHCHRHANQEHREASARCKREFERLRQTAGRKTLGQIAQEFELFLEAFREDRRLENADIRHRQKQVVLGTSASTQPSSVAGTQETEWDWRYTPRPCTKVECQLPHYSPFANHLYSFYTTPRPSTFIPMHTLCPTCAQAEVEAFENSIEEKWESRCGGWDEAEWNDWLENACNDRAMEVDFWVKAQERVVRETGPAMWVKRAAAQEQQAVGKAKNGDRTGKRKSLFKRLFTSK